MGRPLRQKGFDALSLGRLPGSPDDRYNTWAMRTNTGRSECRRARRRQSGAWVGAVLAGAVLIGTTQAQTPRLRTLVYEPERHDWIEEAPPPAGTAEGDLYAIRTAIKNGRHRAALSATARLVKKYGESDAVYPEALLAKAEALIGLKSYDKAHNVLQTFLSEFGGMSVTPEAMRLEFVIAEAWLGGAKRVVWGIFRVSGEDKAYEILDEISGEYPDQRIAELAIKTKADHLFRIGEHALAELEYGRMLREYPQSRYHQFAMGRTAESALASFEGVDYDEAALIEAEERYNDYRNQYRGSADNEGVGLILDSIREMRAEKDFEIGQYYEKTEHFASAVYYYRSATKSYSDTIGAAKAAARLELLGGGQPIADARPNDRGDGR